MLNKKFVFTIILMSVSSVCVGLTDQAVLAQELGWVIQPNNPHNICNGYYQSLPILYVPNPLVRSQQDNYDFYADQTTYSLKGVSTAIGHVRVTQPQSEMTANRAFMYRSRLTNKPQSIKLDGNVRLRAPGKLVVAKSGDFNVQTKVKTLYDAHYRMSLGDQAAITTDERAPSQKKNKKELRDYQLNAQGEAKKFTQYSPTYAVLRDATYTTCPLTTCAWKMRASTVKLNKKTGRGVALNTRLTVHDVPVFYMPYFNFPIDKRRQTGFLWPAFGYSSSDGATASFPFYWNLAPNYDATITPRVITKRGLLMDGVFRYLTPFDQGRFEGGVISNDREFQQFQNSAPKNFARNPALARTTNADDNRRAFSWLDHSQLTDHFTSDVNYNYVSDDYYLQDFNTNIMDVSDDQLLRQAKVNYADDYWSFLGNVQAYQTLHRVNGGATNQYARLPQLQFNADYPDQLSGLDYGLATEFDRFSMNPNPGTIPQPLQGNRASVDPSISLPLSWVFAYITPKIKLHMVKYQVNHQAVGNSTDPDVAIPIFDVKTGVYFDRFTQIFHHSYRQTLEPVLYYLYVPYRNQNGLPYFDTSLQALTYDTMFQNNRFSGLDRVGDANQLTYGVESRFIDDETGDQKASVSVGQIHYFRDRKVSLYSGRVQQPIIKTDQRVDSPIAALATYNMTQYWSATAGAAWSTYRNAFDNDNVGVTYQLDPARVINLNYNYSLAGDTLSGARTGSAKNDLKQVNLSTYWRIDHHWSILGRLNYSLSHQHTQGYFYGVVYNACCWAVRFVNGQTFVGQSPLNQFRTFDDYSYRHQRVFYIQFALKGLSNVGDTATENFLAANITNYVDQFGEERGSNE